MCSMGVVAVSIDHHHSSLRSPERKETIVSDIMGTLHTRDLLLVD